MSMKRGIHSCFAWVMFALAGCAAPAGGVSTAEVGDGPDGGAFVERTTYASLAGDREVLGHRLAPDETIEWSVYAPPGVEAGPPAGLVVNISPHDSGAPPRAWRAVLDRHRLVWVGANHSGNRVAPWRRMLYATLAPIYASRRWPVDASRVWLTGFSGGGRTASLLAAALPELFTGALYQCGVNWPEDASEATLVAMASNRYVFVSGSRDFNLADTRRVHDRYRDAGIEQVRLIVVNGMAHDTPPAAQFEQAVRFLEGEVAPAAR